MHRQNQSLEQDSAAMHQDRLRLEHEAEVLAQRLDAVMHDKFERQSSGFDADTPIDKTLNFLHTFIAVSGLCPFPSACHTHHVAY